MPPYEQEMYLLIARHLAFQTSKEEDDRLFDWIGRSAENAQVFEQLKTVWLSGRRQPEMDSEAVDALDALKDRLGFQTPAGPSRRKTRAMLALFAALLIVTAACIWFGRSGHPAGSEVVEKVAGISEPLSFVMEDGTAVWLAPGSRIKYTTGKNIHQREAFLEGQAFIKATRDPHLPFVVHAGSFVTEVLGTTFNISAFDNQDKLTIALVEGKIRVSDTASELNCLLQPGMELVYNKSTRETRVRKTGAEENVGAWVEKTVTFNNITLAEAAVQLQAVYGVRLVFADSAAAACRIWGRFRDQPLDNILQTITLTGAVRCTKGTGNTVIISKDK